MRILILNYTGNEENWGCQATSKNLVNLLNGMDANIEYIDIETNSTKYRSFLNKIRLKIIITFINKIKTLRIFTYLFKFFHTIEFQNIEKLKNCDILILNGEGSLHAWNKEVSKFLHYLAFAKINNKKVYIVNHSLQFDNKKAQHFLKNIYLYSEKNYFREKISFETANAIGVKNAYIVPDAAFLNFDMDTSSVDLSRYNLPKKYILASGSVSIENPKIAYFHLLKKLSDFLNLQVVFIASCRIDKAYREVVSSKYNYIYLDNDDLKVEEVQKLMNDCYLFYSGRFHLNIFSITSGKIFIPFASNTIKMPGLIELIDYPLGVINLDGFVIENELEKIKKLIEDRVGIERKMISSSKYFSKEIKNMYSNLLK